MKNKDFFAYLIAVTALFIGAIQIFGLYEEAKQQADYHKWRAELHQKYDE